MIRIAKHTTKRIIMLSSLFLLGCAGVAQQHAEEDYAQAALQMMQADFKGRGAVPIERLTQRDAVQNLCSQISASGGTLSAEQGAQLEKEQLASVKYPADGQYLGDWKRGEAIAQNGRGMQTSDAVGGVNGGNCYACHQITKAEISFGNIGPSLYQYAKLRGMSEELKRYTWAKIYNAQAYRACSPMPRFGHQGILNEQQMKDVAALLLDPQSPVNQ